MKSMITAAVVLALFCAPSFAATIVVDWSGGGDYTLIQDGVDAASYGDTVAVVAGYYNERIEMENGVALLGAGADVTIIDGTGWDYSTVILNGLFSDDTIVEGFRIQGGVGPGWSASGVWLGLECSAIVRYNVIIGNRMGVMVNYNNGNPKIDHNTIFGNSDCGIQVYVGNGVYVTGVASITNNIIGENDHYGIYRGYDGSSDLPPMPDVDYNDVYESGYLDYSMVDAGPSDFSLLPMFCWYPTDMRIPYSSPCAGTGSGGSDRGAFPATDCDPVPVEDASWGAIKAMYR